MQSLARVRGTATAQFKGLPEPLTLYDVDALTGDHAIALPDKQTRVIFTSVGDAARPCFEALRRLRLTARAPRALLFTAA